MATVSKSFTAVGLSDGLTVRHGEQFTYDVSGTFSGSVRILRSSDGGKSYVQIVGPFTSAASGTVIANHPDQSHATYYFNCTARASGTIVTSMVDVAEIVQSFN